MSSRMRKLNTRFSVLILLVPLLCNLLLFSQVAYAEAKNALISNLPAKIENGLLDAIEDAGQVSLPDVVGAGKDNPTLMGEGELEPTTPTKPAVLKSVAGTIYDYFDYEGVPFVIKVSQRRAFMDYEITFDKMEENFQQFQTDQEAGVFPVEFGVDGDRVGSVESITLNDKPIKLDSKNRFIVNAKTEKQVFKFTLRPPANKKYGLMIVSPVREEMYEDGHVNNYIPREIHMGVLFFPFASDWVNDDQKMTVYDEQDERATLKRPDDLIPTETLKGYSATIKADAYSDPNKMKVYLNQDAVEGDYLIIEERLNADKRSKLANMWGETWWNSEQNDHGLYYYEKFNEQSPGKNYSVMISVIELVASRAKRGEITIYYPYVGTYKTKHVDSNGDVKWTTHLMGAYVTLSDFIPGTNGGHTGGDGDNADPYLNLSNNLYSGLLYNKLSDFQVEFQYVDFENKHLIDVQKTDKKMSYLTFASLNANRRTNPWGPDAAIEKRYDYAEGVGWAGPNENKGVTVEGATITYHNGKYIGTTDAAYQGQTGNDIWQDYLNGENFERSAVSFVLEGTSAKVRMGSLTNGVWGAFLSSSISVPNDEEFSFDIDTTVGTRDKPSVNKFVHKDTNDLNNTLLADATKPFWYWTYPTTYANGEDYLLSPTAVEAIVNLPKVGGDAVILAGAIADSVQVYNTAGTGDDATVGNRAKMTHLEDYKVTIEDRKVKVTLTKEGVRKLMFNGSDWAVGVNVRHSVAEYLTDATYTQQSAVSYTFDNVLWNRTQQSNVVSHQRKGTEPEKPSEAITASFAVKNMNQSGDRSLVGGEFELIDDKGKQLPKQNSGSHTTLWGGLTKGEYTLRQTGVANGYWLDNTTYQVTVVDGVVTVDLPTSADSGSSDVHEVIFSNDVNGLVFRKFVLGDDPNKPLAGSTYRLTRVSSGHGREFTTRETGQTLPGLSQGLYTLEEIAAPTGFVVDQKVYCFEVTATGIDGSPTEMAADCVPLGDKLKYDKAKDEWLVDVPAEQVKSIFPRVGGSGVMMFWVVPGVLLLISGSMAYRQRRQ
ncbi:prealbumin-like fold domain-containing protein [Weissella confusa]|uniref:MSCRAMM family protein n=2 Tax=Weissella confusa TaxID=1583 RepID=UPI00070564F7|nr:prealbumin-like fold domain-containing protein [Weissella confusa]MBJ7697995.1 hypothetical protein [Weissella confusa]MCQ8095946.1 SpaA isopeptide-forming pilin-related protein [Weissella confusa]MCQ8145376.1 SpaA isopeptide-forming pilin-related protein [Weissella confusa]TGE75194.1 hypothetical protein C6P09_01190 [Weissella confusa]GEO56189.1 hypothetical protein WCO01_13910 [Weissella confusa]